MKRKNFLKNLGLLGASAVSIPLINSCSKNDSSNGNSNSLEKTSCGDFITPPVNEGPYYVNENLNRSNISETKTGVPLTLIFTVEDVNCVPIQGAIVDIWQCDKDGIYSDEAAQSTVGQKWLRGYQQTDINGKCTFQTIFPGWYNGRLTHIHGKVKVGSVTKQTTNFFLPKSAELAVYGSSLYTKGQNPTTVANDVELRGNTTSYNALMMTIEGDLTSGYVAKFAIAYK